MYRHQGVQALPVELLALSFDYLSVRELVTASHVSMFWRAAACRHQTFWRNITLAALSTSAVDFFQARLDAGLSRSALVNISLHAVECPGLLRSVVFPAISRHLHRIDKLSLRIDISFDVDLFKALEHSAPRLGTLDIILCHETRSSDALPATLFACHAPNLRNVRILNVQLLSDRIPHAFSAVTHFRYCFNEAQSFPTALFEHCKQLQSLTIYGRDCIISSNGTAAVSTDKWQLSAVEVAVYTGTMDLLSRIPCATIPSVTVAINDELLAPSLLAHLRGRLGIRMYSAKGNIYVQYASTETGMQRGFAGVPEQVLLACLPPVLTAHGLLSRVGTVSCTSDCAPLLSAYAEMEACTRLAVSITESEPLRPLPRPLSLPALECVEISSAAASRMRSDDVLSFLESALRPMSQAVRVALVGIELDGPFSELGQKFIVRPGTVRHSHYILWLV